MNEKIGLTDLTRAIASECGLDTKACDTFLRTLFATIGQSLVEGENVKVKGIGTFKSTDVEQRKSVNVNTGQEMLIPGHKKVTFTPDKALAEAVNAPFAMFEPVELADDLTEQMLAEAETDTAPAAPAAAEDVEPAIVPDPIAEPQAAADPEPEPEPVAVPLPEPEPEPEPQADGVVTEAAPAVDTEAAEPQAATPAPSKDVASEPYIYEPEIVHRHRSHFGKGFIIGMLCTAVAAACALLAWRFISPASLAQVSESIAGSSATQAPQPAPPAAKQPATAQPPAIVPVKGGEAADVPTTPSDQQATPKATEQDTKADKPAPKAYADKITKKRYLTTMAREYYGNHHLWPYIYDYNKGLGHPDRIRPGTKIQVPTAETLGIDPTDPATISKAKARGIEIYKRYR